MTILLLAGGLLFGAAVAGCGGPRPPQQRRITYDYDPVKNLRSYLEGYRDGRPVTSECELFPKLVEEIRKTDPDKAAQIEPGLNTILKAPANAPAEAKKLLDVL